MRRFMASLLALTVAGLIALPANAAEEKERDLDAIFKKLDKDSNGKLSFEEFKGKREEEKARKSFDRKDKDKSGDLSLEEFKAVPKKKTE